MKKFSLILAFVASMLSGSAFAQNVFFSDVEFLNNSTKANLEISIDADEYAAILECVITLPEGISIEEGRRGYVSTIEDIADGFTSTISKRDNGDFYVLVSNNNNWEFLEKAGKVLTISLVKDETLSDGIFEANVHSIVLGTAADAANNVSQINTETEATFKIGANTTVGIRSITADGNNAPVYNTAGQRVSRTSKGLYIQNGKKVVKK